MDVRKMHIIEIRFITGLETVLFASVCMHFQAQKFYGLGQ